jgi:hypothetical protein
METSARVTGPRHHPTDRRQATASADPVRGGNLLAYPATLKVLVDSSSTRQDCRAAFGVAMP